MVQPVEALIDDFAAACASSITFHPGACTHVDRALSQIRDAGCRAGLVLNPHLGPEVLHHVLDKLDMVLMMLAIPGSGGLTFITSTLYQVWAVRTLLDSRVWVNR